MSSPTYWPLKDPPWPSPSNKRSRAAYSTVADANTTSDPDENLRHVRLTDRPSGLIAISFRSGHPTLSPGQNEGARSPRFICRTRKSTRAAYATIYPLWFLARSRSKLPFSPVSFVRGIDVSTPIRLKAYIHAIDSNN